MISRALKDRGTNDSIRYDSSSQPREALEICALDPLGADEAVRKLPAANAIADVPGIVNLLRPLIPSLFQVHSFNTPESIAAMRDLGIFLGSVKRHGVEPVAVLPELEPVLFALAEKVDMPPRDTVIHYTIWNPDGQRRRHYTAHDAELHLVSGTKMSLYRVENAIRLLVDWHEIPMTSNEFPPAADAIENELHGLVDNVLYAMRHVPRKVFAEELRFYFDPVVVGGKPYLGPGAVEVPTFVADHLLWTSQVSEPEYVDFKRTYVPYQRPWIRNVFHAFDGRPSLLDKAKQAMAAEASPQVLDSAIAILKIMSMLVKFRVPHKRLADEAYSHSSTLVPGRSHGSGGYTTEILDYINSMTIQVRNEWRDEIRARLRSIPPAHARRLLRDELDDEPQPLL